MRILHVIASIAPRYGGPSNAVVRLCREMARLGHDVAIFTTNVDGKENLDVPLERMVEMDGFQIRYSPIQWPRYYGFSLPFGRALAKNISRFDIVQIHSIYNFHTLAASHYCRKFNVPYLIHPHGSLDPYLIARHRVRKWIYTSLFLQRDLDHAAAIRFCTQEEMQLTESIGIKAPGVVVPEGVDPSEFSHLPARGSFSHKYPEVRDKKIVLFLSRVNFKKGLDILARAFGEVARKRKDVYLVLTGPDNEGYGTKVRAWLREEGALGRSLFTGMLSGQEKLAALRDSDIFVLSSYTENFGIAVVEAMACGLPVVISNKVNIWRDVNDAGAGIVTNCESHEVAEAIMRLLDNRNLREEMGKRGKRVVEEKYTWQKVARQMIEMYEDILESHRANRFRVRERKSDH